MAAAIVGDRLDVNGPQGEDSDTLMTSYQQATSLVEEPELSTITTTTSLVPGDPDKAKRHVSLAFEIDQTLDQCDQIHAFVHNKLKLWVFSHVIPHQWRCLIVHHLEELDKQLQSVGDRIGHHWESLIPPFPPAHDKRLVALVNTVRHLNQLVVQYHRVLEQYQTQIEQAQRLCACRFLQQWVRRVLAQRGFYTQVVQLTRHHRGLIPGMFDTIHGKSRLVVDHDGQVFLEYPLPHYETTLLNSKRCELFQTSSSIQ